MDPFLKVAIALDNLLGRMYSGLHPDASYLNTDDPEAMRAAITGFCAYAEQCSEVLDDPAVRAAFAEARKEA